MSLALAACDPMPVTEFRNGSDAAVTLKSERAVSALGDLKAEPKVAAGRRVRTLSIPDSLIVAAGGCDYLYAIPEGGLVAAMGAVNHVEIAPDLTLYLQARGSAQPPGWPVRPTSRTCR